MPHWIGSLLQMNAQNTTTKQSNFSLCLWFVFFLFFFFFFFFFFNCTVPSFSGVIFSVLWKHLKCFYLKTQILVIFIKKKTFGNISSKVNSCCFFPRVRFRSSHFFLGIIQIRQGTGTQAPLYTRFNLFDPTLVKYPNVNLLTI